MMARLENKETDEYRLVNEMAHDESSCVIQLCRRPPVNMTVAARAKSWREEFLISTAASVSHFSGTPPPADETAAAQLIKDDLYICTAPPTAIQLGIFLRHFVSHVSEIDPGKPRGAHMSDHVISALTTNPYTRSKFSSRLEYIIRHPATGWFWPEIWRRLYNDRAALHRLVCERYYIPVV